MQPWSRELSTLSSAKHSCNWLPSKWSTLPVFTQLLNCLVIIICGNRSCCPVPWNFKYADHFCPSWCEVWQKKIKVYRINNLKVTRLTLTCFSYVLEIAPAEKLSENCSTLILNIKLMTWNQVQLLTSISPAAAVYFCDTSWHSSPINEALWFLLMALLIVTLWKINTRKFDL